MVRWLAFKYMRSRKISSGCSQAPLFTSSSVAKVEKSFINTANNFKKVNSKIFLFQTKMCR